jgi:hypothetical protein
MVSAVYSDSFARPADTTAYAANDLVANNTTAGSVEPLQFITSNSNGGFVRAVRITHSDPDATNSSFRVWFLSALPTVTNGDNGALAGAVASTILGTVEVTVDENMGGSCSHGWVAVDPNQLYVPETFYALIEATAAYTPASGETFVVYVRVDSI